MPDDLTPDIPEVMLSRSGISSPHGSQDQPVKTTVDIDTEAAFKRMCSESGMVPAQVLRDWIFKFVHKKTFSQILMEDVKAKHDRFFGTGPEQVQNESKS